MTVDIATLGIKITTDAPKAATEMDQATAAAVRLQAATNELAAKKVGLTQAELALVQATAKGEQVTRQMLAAVGDSSRALQLMSNADDLAAKAAAAAAKAHEDLTNRAARLAGALDPAVKAQQQFATRTKEVNDLVAAGVLTQVEGAAVLGKAKSAFEAAAAAATKHAGATSLVTRETIVLGREFARGDFTRMAGSATILAGALGILPALFNPITLAAVALTGTVVALAAAFNAGEEEVAHFNNSLKATGQAAGITYDQMLASARKIAAANDNTVSAAFAAEQAVVSTGKVAGEAVAITADAAERLADLTGKKTSAVVAELVGLYGDAAKGAEKLSDSVHFLTVEQYAAIKALQDSGDSAGAFALAMKDLDDHLKNEGTPDMGFFEKAIHGVHQALDETIQSLKEFGREATPAMKVALDLRRINTQQTLANARPFDPAVRQDLSDAYGKLQTDQDAAARAQTDAAVKATEVRIQTEGAHALDHMQQLDASLKGSAATIKREQDQYVASVKAVLAADPANKQALEDQAHMTERLAAIAKRNTPGGRGRQDQSASAIDTALKDQESAQLALTKDAEQQATIKHAQVATELKTHEDQLARQVKEHAITAAASQIADGYYKQAAALKDQLIEVEKQHALDQVALAQREAVGGYQDRETQAREALAKNAEQYNQLEADALGRRQKLEADILAERLKYLLGLHQITDAQAREQTAALAEAQAAEQAALAEQERVRKISEQYANINSPLQADADILKAKQSLLRSSYAQAVLNEQIVGIETQIAINDAKEAAQRAIPGSDEQHRAEDHLRAVEAEASAARQLADREANLSIGIQDATAGIHSFSDAIRRHDWFAAFNSLISTIDAVEGLLQKSGSTSGASGGGFLSKLFGLGGGGGTFDSSTIARGFDFLGGTSSDSFAGVAEDMTFSLDKVSAGLAKVTEGTGGGGFGGLGFGGGGVGGLLGIGMVGNALSSALGVRQTSGAQAGGLAGGALAGMLIAGPIGAVIGAVLGNVLGSVLGGKPSNHAGITTLTPDSFQFVSTGKETADTKNAVTGAAQAVIQGEQALKGFGIQLNTTVTKLDLGTRDMTHIFLSTGEEIRSAVGDPAAAADAALKAVLQGATYTDQAEKKLVDSMLAAGAGFDQIAQKLQAYAAAQQAVKDVADALLQATNPEAYDIKKLKDSIAQQRQAAEDAYTAGYLTADQLTTVNDQLNQLANLKLQDIFKQYANDVSNASTALKKFREGLDTGPNALLSPEAAYQAARSTFYSTSTKAEGGDAQAQANLQDASQAFLDASKQYFASSGGYFNDLNAVKSAVDQVLALPGAATADPSMAIQQQQASLLADIDKSLIDIKALIAGGNALTTVTATATDPTMATTTATTLDAATTQAITYAEGTKAALYQQWYGTGFATGGAFTNGVVSRPTSFNMAQMGEAGPEGILPLTNVGGRLGVHAIRGANDNSGLEAKLAQLIQEVAILRQQLAKHGEAVTTNNSSVGQKIVAAFEQNKTARLAAGASIS